MEGFLFSSLHLKNIFLKLRGLFEETTVAMKDIYTDPLSTSC